MNLCHVKTKDGSSMFACKWTSCANKAVNDDCLGISCPLYEYCEYCIFEAQDAETGGIVCNLEQ